MRKINFMIVDDEKLVLENLKLLLRQFPDVEVVYESTEPVRAIEELDRWKDVDVAILDVNMPEMNGIEMAARIFAHNPGMRIIFLTAYEEYALDAFESNAVDYILKPVTARRFRRTLDKLHVLLDVEEERKEEKPENSRGFVGFANNQYYPIPYEKGCYITIENRNIILAVGNEKYLLKNTLNEWEEELSSHGWFRCHKAYLINVAMIERTSPMVNSTYFVHMKGCEEEVPVSRSYSGAFKQRLGM